MKISATTHPRSGSPWALPPCTRGLSAVSLGSFFVLRRRAGFERVLILLEGLGLVVPVAEVMEHVHEVLGVHVARRGGQMLAFGAQEDGRGIAGDVESRGELTIRVVAVRVMDT